MKSYEDSVKKTCLQLFRDKKIEKQTYNFIRPDTKKCPILYGLPKLHKDGVPMRPIVDYRNTPGHALSIFLKSILKCIIGNHEHTLKNSYEFVECIEDIQLGPMDTMVSYDIISLFTNVPIEQTLEIVLQRLKSNTLWKTKSENLTLTDISTLLKLVSENYVTWRGKYYKQTSGTPMGSPLSPILAEVFLQDMELKIIPTIPYVKIWRRMVDDIFAVVRKRKEETILSIANSFHTDIQLTIEKEKDNTLNFLDVTLTRKGDGKLSRKVYRKKTHSNRYLDWNSHHHKSQKIAVIDSLTTRAIRICDESSLQSELDFIENILVRNGFPRKVIQKRMLYIQNKPTNSNKNQTSNDSKWCAIPFIGSVTYQVAGILRKNLNRDLGYYTGRKLSRILNNYKDMPPLITCGVYVIHCDCGSVYVGETKNLEQRKANHRGDLRNHRTDQSALADHQDQNPSHSIDVGSTALLCYEKRWFQRMFKEAIFIHHHPNNMNRNTGYDIGSWIPLAITLI